MKKGKWMIFKCQNCGKKFEEKPPKDKEYEAVRINAVMGYMVVQN